MTFSINTNYSAMVALQNLSTIQENLDVSRSRVSTGLRVQTGADDAIAFRSAETLKGTNALLSGNLEAINRGSSVLDLTLNTTTQVTALLNTIRDKAVQYQSALATTDIRTQLQGSITGLRQQIDSLVGAAKYFNLNLINATSVIPLKLNAPSGATAAAITLSVSATALDTTALALSGITMSSTAKAVELVAAVDAALKTVSTTVGGFAGMREALKTVGDATKAQIDNNKAAISQFVDADLQAESSAIQALQIQQQLAAQALTIANANPQVLLRLFKN